MGGNFMAAISSPILSLLVIVIGITLMVRSGARLLSFQSSAISPVPGILMTSFGGALLVIALTSAQMPE
jgi:hypothetical protein